MASYQGYSEHYHQQPELYRYDASPVPNKGHYSDLEAVRQSQHVQHPPPPPPNEKEQSRKICGLRTVTFVLVFALIVAILCIAAVGGGLGGALASKSSSSDSSPTRTVTVSGTGTATAAAASSAVPTYGFARNFCKNHTIYEAPTGARFRMYCGIDWAGGDNQKGGGTVVDILTRSAGSWESCMDQCAEYNKKFPNLPQDKKCNAAAFHSDLTTSFAAYGCNCWFKSGAGVQDTVVDDDPAPEQYAVAELLSS